MAQFKANINMLTTADSGPRNARDIIWLVLHTTENDAKTTRAREVAAYQLNPQNQSSYNILFDPNGTTVRSNDDLFCPWASGMPGNRLGLHGSAVGRASDTRAQWFERKPQLETIARWLAHSAKEYNLPLRFLTVEEVKARKPGVTTHAVYWQAIGKAQGMDVRTDPGDNFPIDWVMTRAKSLLNPAPVRPLPKRDRQDLILDQLAGYPWQDYPGWPQLGGLTLVDAVAEIGRKVGLDWGSHD